LVGRKSVSLGASAIIGERGGSNRIGQERDCRFGLDDIASTKSFCPCDIIGELGGVNPTRGGDGTGERGGRPKEFLGAW